MSETSPYGFDVARRGYARGSVDGLTARILSDQQAALRRITALNKQLADAERQAYTVAAAQEEAAAAVSYESLSVSAGRIHRLAAQEAASVRTRGSEDAATQMHLADAQARRSSQAAAEASGAVRMAAEEAAEHLLRKAEQTAIEMRDATSADTQARRTKADAYADTVRQEAESVTVEVAVRLAQRRDQADEELAARLELAEELRARTERKGEESRQGAEADFAAAERSAQHQLETAEAEAARILAKALADASRISGESERCLAVLADQRDSISEQLHNTRRMLASLTGSPSLADQSRSEAPQH
ncbi:hypothetical protein [Streptomyces sp. N35]|uniref:hypothetical protein n=1 Tax=Streptomyces sp. N35 TaxID=2795730 RepID=UPI0018F40E40|nr:hypothetical protein [Streptomyces sp. N35]